ncbi:MAG: hypothetical protein ACYC9K_01515 [Sulfuricaulis sp.]
MITLFAVPKPFRGHIGTIQRNAIASWTKLSAEVEVILFGDEEGIAEEAKRFGVRHEPAILKNEFGTPLLGDLFSKARNFANNNALCYVNADIILMSDFIQAAKKVVSASDKFLMTGRRWNLDIDTLIDSFQENWEAEIRKSVDQRGVQAPPECIDYFLFSRSIYREVPPFAIGRAVFDNWLLWRAHAEKAAVVDASTVVLAVHQNHDYAHHPQGKNGVWNGEEAKRNRELMGDWLHCYTLQDATYLLTTRGLRRNLGVDRLRSHIKRSWLAFMLATQPFRHRSGLRLSTLSSVATRLRKR